MPLKYLEFVLCWPNTPSPGACPGVGRRHPVALHERKLVFPLPAAMLCFVAGYFVPTSHVVLGLVCLEPAQVLGMLSQYLWAHVCLSCCVWKRLFPHVHVSYSILTKKSKQTWFVPYYTSCIICHRLRFQHNPPPLHLRKMFQAYQTAKNFPIKFSARMFNLIISTYFLHANFWFPLLYSRTMFYILSISIYTFQNASYICMFVRFDGLWIPRWKEQYSTYLATHRAYLYRINDYLLDNDTNERKKKETWSFLERQPIFYFYKQKSIYWMNKCSCIKS